MNTSIITTDATEKHEIALQLTNKTFAELILNFLGKKEKLVFQGSIPFILRHNDIEQFYFLLENKIKKEQNIYIDHFLVDFAYNDNTHREISGIEALSKFNETRDVYPISVTLTWNLIVKFPNSETIENQLIEMSFITDDKEKTQEIADGKVILTISHTNQAWGIEVLNLFKDKIRNVSLEKPKQYRVANMVSEFFTRDLIFPLLMLLTSLFMAVSLHFENANKKDGIYH